MVNYPILIKRHRSDKSSACRFHLLTLPLCFRSLRRSQEVPQQGDKRSQGGQDYQQEVPRGGGEAKAAVRNQHSETNGSPQHP